MADERVVSSLEDGVLTITLNRANKRNALDAPMVDGLHAALERADLDAEVRAVGLRGAGKDFCAGADLQELLDSANLSPDENRANAQRLGDVFIRIRELAKPVVAIVHGHAFGGGCGLATACDLVLAHADAQFGYPEIRRGFVPAMVMTILRRVGGEKWVFDLVTTGRVLSAKDAWKLGLVSRVIPAAQFEAETTDVLQHLAATSASALALTKRLFYELDGRSFSDGIALGADVNAMARTTPDFRKAIEAFLNK
jgi:methylglutaconyl-CoA hydratase